MAEVGEVQEKSVKTEKCKVIRNQTTKGTKRWTLMESEPGCLGSSPGQTPTSYVSITVGVLNHSIINQAHLGIVFHILFP